MRKLLKTCIPAPEPTYKTFTVRRQEVSSPQEFFFWYSDDAANLSQGDAAFDEFFAYRPVLLDSNGNVTAELNPNDFTKTIDWEDAQISQWDNVMIEFPIRWIKMSKENDIVTLSITDNPDAEADWFQYYAHSRWTFDNPIKKDKFYLWAYKARNSTNTGTLVSWSAQAPTTNMNLSTAIALARAIDWNDWSNWYDINGFYQRMYIVALYFMKYCNPDIQSVIWLWVTWASQALNTWWANTVWMNGSTDATSNIGRVKLFWLEDLRWNAHERIGWYKSNSNYQATTTLSNFNATWEWYTTQSAWLVTTRQNYNIISIAWDNESMFMPTNNSNNVNYDTYYCNNSQVLPDRYTYWWWTFNQWRAAGITRFYAWAQPSWSAWTRIMYL